MLRSNQDQDTIQIYNIKILVLGEEQHGFSKLSENPTRLWSGQLSNLPLIRLILPYKMNLMMMTLHNRIMQLSILEISTQSIITCLNKLPYLSGCWYHESRYVHVASESLMMEYGL